jgi:DNA-directed RNA polymerase subunit K/omega
MNGDASSEGQGPGALEGPALQITNNRFLFVDVAAQRAKQLRRGALPRLQSGQPEGVPPPRADAPHKLERVAMEEVRQGVIPVDLPDLKSLMRALEGK